MRSPAELPRYEVKVPCAAHWVPQLAAWVRLDPAHWRVAYPPRQVNNVYFDTVDYQNLNDNLGGAGERSKLRLRWYDPTLERVDGARLELKSREGAVGRKAVCPLDLALDLAQRDWPALYQALYQAADAAARLWLEQTPCPVLINHYQRAYYTTPDSLLRLTIDTDLRAYDQRLSNHPNLTRPAMLAETAVVEFKTAVDTPAVERLSEVLGRLPLRVDRHSKYVRGMLAGPDFDRVELL